MVLSMLVNHPMVDVLYNPLLDDSERMLFHNPLSDDSEQMLFHNPLLDDAWVCVKVESKVI